MNHSHNHNHDHDHDQESMVDRFKRSARIDAEHWRDPQHDLMAIQMATPTERDAIEDFLIVRGVQHFIDAEALALLDTPRARKALRDAFQSGTTEVRAAISHLAPHLINEDRRITELIQRIDECDPYNGLSLTLTQIESLHPPEVIHALLRRIASDPGVAATHFAGMVLYLHGQASEPFDWAHRPFLLRFNPGDEPDRRQAFSDLCVKIGQDVAHFDHQWPTF